MNCQDCKCELAPWEVGAYDRCYSCECKQTRERFKAHAETETALKQSPPEPPPMVDGRGREVPLHSASESFAKMAPPPTVEYRKTPPGAALPIAGLVISLLIVVIAFMSAHGC